MWWCQAIAGSALTLTFSWSVSHATLCSHERVPPSVHRGLDLEPQLGRCVTKMSSHMDEESVQMAAMLCASMLVACSLHCLSMMHGRIILRPSLPHVPKQTASMLRVGRSLSFVFRPRSKRTSRDAKSPLECDGENVDHGEEVPPNKGPVASGEAPAPANVDTALAPAPAVPATVPPTPTPKKVRPPAGGVILARAQSFNTFAQREAEMAAQEQKRDDWLRQRKQSASSVPQVVHLTPPLTPTITPILTPTLHSTHPHPNPNLTSHLSPLTSHPHPHPHPHLSPLTSHLSPLTLRLTSTRSRWTPSRRCSCSSNHLITYSLIRSTGSRWTPSRWCSCSASRPRGAVDI